MIVILSYVCSNTNLYNGPSILKYTCFFLIVCKLITTSQLFCCFFVLHNIFLLYTCAVVNFSYTNFINNFTVFEGTNQGRRLYLARYIRKKKLADSYNINKS